MFEKITKTLSGLAFIKYINSLIDYVNTSDIDATRIKGQLDISNIPPAGLDNVIKVDTVTDMLALTVDDVQNGDTVMIIGVTPPVQYQVVDDTKLGTMDAFQEYAAGTATKALADINGNNIHTTYGKLAGNNTWTGSNTYNSNIVVKANGTAEVVEGSVYLGRSSKTNQARITGDATGNLYLTNSEDGYTYINNGSNSVAYFDNATIRFYKPTYITNGSSAGSSATLYLGVKPTNETVQARIGTDNLGGLFYHASTNQPHVFRVGTNNNVFVIHADNTKVAFSSNNNFFATVTYDGVAKWLGNANTATKLETARTINGVSFDGTANITIADSTKLPIAGGTMTGDLTLKGNPTADLMAATKKYVDDSVASAGGGSNLTTYTSLEQLGITPGQETFASIHSALPINSVLECYVSEAQNFADIYPASYGNFIATRLTEDITIFHFTGTNQIIYVTHYHVTANTNPSWTQIAKQSDLTNLSNSVVKSVNGIKPTNGNVTIDIPEPVIASEAEAKAGTNNTKFMTPLRVAQAIDSLDGNPITGASISGKTITLTKKDGSKITLNTQDTNTSNWSISIGTNGWARENATGFTIQWWVGNTDATYRSITYPRSFSTLYYANVIASSNCETFVTGVSNTSISFCLCNGYNNDRWSGSQPCRLYACGLT